MQFKSCLVYNTSWLTESEQCSQFHMASYEMVFAKHHSVIGCRG